MTWIRVHAIPNEENLDEPRMTILLDTAQGVTFAQRPGEDVQVWLDWNIHSSTPIIRIAESLEDIEALIDAKERIAEQRRADMLLSHGARPGDTVSEYVYPRTSEGGR